MEGNKLGKETENDEIRQFLQDVKTLLSANRYDFVPRKKNLQSLALHGLSLKEAKDEIFSLVVSDYYKGPKRIMIRTDPEISGNSKRI